MSHQIHTDNLGNYVRVRTGKLDANANDPNGEYPFFTCAVEPLKITAYSYDCECVLVAGNGDLNVKYFNGKFDAYQRTYIIESTDKSILDVRYLFHFLSEYVNKLREMCIGGVIKYIKLNFLTDAQIYLPPIDEQRRIAGILDKADAIRYKRQESIRLTNVFLRSVFLDMFGDPVKNSKKWEMKKFADVGTLDRGVSKNRPRNAPELLGGPYPLIQTGDVANSNGYIRSYKSTYSEVGLRQSKMWPSGTLCITIAANIAKTGILTFDACFPDSVVGFAPNELTTTEYVQSWLGFLQKSLEENAPESAQKNINLDILRKLNIPVPDIELQHEFTKRVKATQDIKSKFVTASVQETQLFESLSQRALNGDL